VVGFISGGMMMLSQSVGVIMGANIGTAVTTAAMGFFSAKSTDALRASAMHVMFNVLGTAGAIEPALRHEGDDIRTAA
jgi:Na+/phosphate symporter